MVKEKKGQAGMITIALIILISIVAIAIIWNVVVPLIKEKGGEVELGGFSVNLQVTNVIRFENGVLRVSVNRGAGEAELEGLKFVFTDSNGNAVTREDEMLDELETKIYAFSPITEIGVVEKVDVAPIINGNIGMSTQSEPGNVLEVPLGVVSWWRFDENTNDFIGINSCSGGDTSQGFLTGTTYCTSNDLDLDEFAISFWIQGQTDRIIIKKDRSYEISLINSKDIKFDDLRGKSETSEFSGGEVGEEWNHIVISISSETPEIYVNNFPRYIENVKNFVDFDGDNLEITGDIADVMFFNKSIDSGAVDGLYKSQLK